MKHKLKIYFVGFILVLLNVRARNVSAEDGTFIEGTENYYIVDDGTTNGVNIVDENGNLLIDIDFRDVDTSLGEYDTLKVWYKEGMNDLSAGILDKDLNIIVPQNFYSQITFVETDGVVYAEALSYVTGDTDRYIVTETSDITYRAWAEESINSAIELGLVPDELMSEYTAKITRAEFCRLAIKTYTAKTGESVDLTETSPFTDTNDPYITFAYKLKIVSGVGNNLFAPDNNITRQEAAVMLNNLADVLNIEKDEARTEAFADESYFADWAKAAIYTVAGIKSGDTYVMAGTGKDENGKDKFSPWMNYTREQAVATMLRLYLCDEAELFYDGQYLQITKEMAAIYGDWLYYTVRKSSDSGDNFEINEDLVRIKKDGSGREVLVADVYSLNFTAVKDNYLYYVVFEKNGNYTNYKMKLDKSEIIEISDNEINEASQRKTIHNDKYKFYYSTDSSDGKSYDLYLMRSGLDGENEKRLYDKPINGQIILFDNYVYFISNTEFTADIMRSDFDGNVENLTNNSEESLSISEIIKITDNQIFYRKTPLSLSDMPSNSDMLYKMSLDGSGDTLIY